MTDPKADDEVRTILARRTPSYREPLLVAWKWNRGGNRADHERAHVLLTELSRRYPHALHVWYELAFGLVRLGRRDAALGVLEHVGDEFRGLLDEDTLCLWGRCYKDAADESLARGLRADQPAGEATAALADADRLYAVAAARYEQAFDLGKNWFPGINLATLWLIRSGLALWLGPQEAEGSAGRRDDWGGRSEALLRSARDLAGELLRQADGWQERLADDRVWTRATRAEAELIRGNWAESAKLYREALEQPHVRPHHRDSVRRQVGRVLTGYRLLGVEPGGPFADPDALFAPPAE